MAHYNNNRGTALLLIIIILSMFIALATTASSLIMAELRINRDMAHSVVAFYAAETAVEKILFEVRKEPTPTIIATVSVSLYMPATKDYSYATASVETINLLIGVATRAVRIRSTGTYKDTSRAIEVTQPVSDL